MIRIRYRYASPRFDTCLHFAHIVLLFSYFYTFCSYFALLLRCVAVRFKSVFEIQIQVLRILENMYCLLKNILVQITRTWKLKAMESHEVFTGTCRACMAKNCETKSLFGASLDTMLMCVAKVQVCQTDLHHVFIKSYHKELKCIYVLFN